MGLAAERDSDAPAGTPGTPTTEKVQGIFSKLAPDYDRFNTIASFGIDRLWRRAAVDAARLDPDSVVLDIAAGTGDLALALARRGRPAKVLATDFVPEMLDVAREKVSRYDGPTRIEFAIADALDLPFSDSLFDAATVAFGVRNFPDRPRNFREVVRVLKPGGRYVILEFSRPVWAPFRPLFHFYLGSVIPLIGGMVSGDRSSFEYLNHSIREFPDRETLAAELRDAGFASVAYRPMTFGMVSIHTAIR